MAACDAHVFPGVLTLVLTQTSFPKPPTTFLMSASEARDENTLERKFVRALYRTHNYQVMSQTRSPLSQGVQPVVEKQDFCD